MASPIQNCIELQIIEWKMRIIEWKMRKSWTFLINILFRVRSIKK